MSGKTTPASGRSVEFTGNMLDKAQRLQAPAVAKYVRALREKHPDDSPAQIITRLEKRYLTAVTGSGSAVGATAAVPGVGTFAALGAMTGETALFLEASALLALAIAEVHGIGVHESERRKTLVLTVALGEEGLSILGRVVGTQGGALRRLGRASAPSGALAKLNKNLMNRIAKKYALKRAPLVIGRLLPAGIGAVIGGAGNRVLGKRVIANAREAFGPPPQHWTLDGTVVSDPWLPRGNP
ncbi:hypothetical protein [Gordonia polyisoprenivorans]|uniref:hypothetical protein n=1 Tax=Gordonia polyisoprenivorans TaxID=84595 RepID=UPI001AD61553|nr:hypothetical protein [Gordonia polyisoprenivorans]QTI71314.1 hypothetical protein J6U32_12815 [Gordonia polyisoprenivorans]